METAAPVQETESSHSPSLAPTCTDSALTVNPFFDYRKLIDDISTRLFKENALRLANLYELPSWYFEIGPSKDPSYALRVLMALEGKGLYSPSNLKGLVEALKNIEREDLCTVVKEFIEKKSAQGLAQERVRRQTHPQTSTYVYKRGQLNPSTSFPGNSNTLQLNPSLMYHSSTSLDTTGAGPRANLQVDIGRSHSRPNLDTFVDGSAVETDAVHPLQPQASPSFDFGASVTGLQMVLISAAALKKQLNLIAKNYPIAESSPMKTHEPAFLMKAVVAAEDVVTNLEQAQSGGSRRFSHSSSYIEMSRVSSRCSEGPDDIKPDPTTLKDETAVMFKSPDKPRKPLIKRSSLTAPRADKMHPAPSSSSDSTSFPLHPLPAISVQSSLSRRRSRKEDKKLSKNGILMWHLKVKRLKDHILHHDSSIESDDFYDSSRRKVRAVLKPHGLGEDAGSHMTLLIHSLDEPKVNSLSNTEIVVNVLDPLSDSPALVIRPIRRFLERRGIRVVQQFMTHSQIENFKSSYITISLAIIGKQQQEESEGSEVEE